MEVDLHAKVAIVTGAGKPRGIGATYARALAGQGAAVACADLDGDGAEQVASTIRSSGARALGCEVDITDPASVQSMMERVAGELGGIDILVNNAALMVDMSMDPIHRYDHDEWRRVLDVNVTGAFNTCRAVVPFMTERGGGKIVNQSSGGAFPPQGVYGVTKLALVALTVALAGELGPLNINVNAIAPGHVRSEAGLSIAPEGSMAYEMITQAAPLGGSREPEALVGALLLLVSCDGDWITGQTMNVDGGWVKRV